MKKLLMVLVALMASTGFALASPSVAGEKLAQATTTKDAKKDSAAAKKAPAPAKKDTASKKEAAAPKSGELLDINTASEQELASLKGIGDVRAKAIVKGRPYKGKDDLVRKKIVPKNVYNDIKDQIIAKQ